MKKKRDVWTLGEIPSSYYPAYTWLWNTTITKAGIREQIEEMYQAGIRAFYIIGEPKEFRPNRRRTYLSPDYLSEEYLELVYYAFLVAEKKGMYTWLYNEGGFPSGMACGQIRKAHPELAQKSLVTRMVEVSAGSEYTEPEDCLGTFCGKERVRDHRYFAEDTELIQYYMTDEVVRADIQTDNAEPENTELFLQCTHEALKAKFGEHMGKEVTMMFDDEAWMGTWSRGLEKKFAEKYGYDLCDYLPCLSREAVPETLKEYRAKSDYCMLCGELVTDNYFALMKRWLNDRKMLSVGHLDRDNCADAPYVKRYGNMLNMLRQFDVPGIDVIWGQVSYPENGRCCYEGNGFFPRLASSAARQQGHSRCLTESFAVYGSHLVPEEMRFVINYQAVRGISIYNFMVISYDRKNAQSFQFRPSFIRENLGMDCMKRINEYTARLSFLLQESKAEIHTALYYPQRTICAGGRMGERACQAYDELGHRLEDMGVAFDIIDEEFVRQAKLCGHKLVGEHVSYDNVFVPELDRIAADKAESGNQAFDELISGIGLESENVIEKMKKTGKAIIPCIRCSRKEILGRKLVFEDGSEGYFICNTHGEMLENPVELCTDKYPVGVDLNSGELFDIKYEIVSEAYSSKEVGSQCGRILRIPVRLLRGEGMMVLLTDEAKTGMTKNVLTGAWKGFDEDEGKVLTGFKAWVSREYRIDPIKGTQNRYCHKYEEANSEDDHFLTDDFGWWPINFSGEVSYLTKLGGVKNGDYVLDLGDVRHFAKVYLNGQKVGEAAMPPYRVMLRHVQEGDELKIVVANTIANVCHDAEFFTLQHPAEVGPYHEKMIVREAKAPAGGITGPVRLLRRD